MRILLSTPILLAALHAPLFSQGASPAPPVPAECQSVLDDIRKHPPEQRNLDIADALKLKQSGTCFARLILERPSVTSAGFTSFLNKLEAVRTDKQAGASSGSGGGTNLASKGTTAGVLSLAAESGALTESVSQQAVTVQGSLDGPFVVLERKNLIPYCPESSTDLACKNKSWYSALRHFSYGVTFNTNQNNQTITGSASGQPGGTAQPVTFTASSRQISAWNARYIIVNHRDDSSGDFKKSWEKLLGQAATKAAAAPGGASTTPSAQPVSDAAKALVLALQSLIAAAQISDDDYAAWYTAAYEAMRSVDLQQKGALESEWKARIDRYLDMVEKANPKYAGAALAYIQAVSRYDAEQRIFVETIASKPVLTLEYDNNRPLGQASTSTARLIFDKAVTKTVSLTANGAFALYNSTLPQNIPGVNRLRDAQFAVQVQKDLGTNSVLGAAAIAGTYYFQYQNSPAILNVTPGTPLPGITLTGLPATATQVFAAKGNLHIGQLRLVLGAGGSSVRFPLAISYSNRTELIAKPAWKAQLGISYDFDSLFARSSPAPAASAAPAPAVK